MSLTRAGRVV